MSVDQVPAEFRSLVLEGLELFDAGEYHDAHDRLEEVWLDEVGTAKRLMQGLIQLAVALYHRKRSNVRGAHKLFRRCAEILDEVPPDLWGFDVKELVRRGRDLAEEVSQQSDRDPPAYEAALIPDFRSYRERLQRLIREP